VQGNARLKTVVVSPHLDDGVFSCGGLVALRARAGTACEVLTLFAGTPEDPDVTPLARDLRIKMGSPSDPVALRRAEDALALAGLGAQAVHLEHLDAVYRRPGRPIFAPEEDGLDRDLSARICEEIASRHPESSEVEIYAPLGVGNHVDHLLAHRACGLLSRRGYVVAFYEDFPYALSAAKLAHALERAGALTREIVPLDEAAISAKVEAMACYRSQAALFFGDLASSGHDAIVEQLGAIVRGRAEQVEPGAGPAERFWRAARI
jgi:LmbE family N-acetylglucosaminyl deacetylase